MSKRRVLAFWCCVAVAALAATYLVWHMTLLKNNERRQQKLAAAAAAVVTPAPQTPAPTATQKPVVIPIDFAALQQQNPDVYAWITIDDTKINNPVLRHPTDDSHYLYYNLDGSKGYPGALYTERCDALDFSDFNTVIYGHNMPDGTNFGFLYYYGRSDYFDAHRKIVVYTPAEKRVYTVFAAVTYSDAYLPLKFNDTNPVDRQAFLNSLASLRGINDQLRDDVPVTADSKLLTLSTCISRHPNNRFLVVAVYTGEE